MVVLVLGKLGSDLLLGQMLLGVGTAAEVLGCLVGVVVVFWGRTTGVGLVGFCMWAGLVLHIVYEEEVQST